MFTPWNEIRPKKYLSAGIPVVPLWQNSCNLSCAIPLGPAPWNLYPACPIDKNGHIEIECVNLLKPDGTVPLGFYNHSKKVYPKAPPAQCWWSLFLWIFCRMTRGIKQEKQNIRYEQPP